jgi:Tfp pilus assembly PilM family ATPase
MRAQVASSWLSASPPTTAIEIASRRVTVAEIGRSSGVPAVLAFATEPLPEGAVVPGLTGTNIPSTGMVSGALRVALARAGLLSRRRAALLVPDSVARVSMLNFDQIPARASDLDQLLRWQLRKATPFPIDEAQVGSFVAHKDGPSTALAGVVARRDVIAQYEAVTDALSIHAGLVDLSSFNVINAVLASGSAPAGDWLLVSLAPEATTLAIMRGQNLMFYRHRLTVDEEPLSTLVHQTAMYHEDRLGGKQFARVWLCGGTLVGTNAEVARDEISERLNVQAEVVDIRPGAELRDRMHASLDVLDILAAPVGALLRDRKVA